MSEIITLSSSDEEEIQSPPKKRIKPTSLDTVKTTPLKINKSRSTENIVILSDEDCGSPAPVRTCKNSVSSKSKDEVNNGHSGHSITIKDDEIDSVTIISEIDDILTTKTNDTVRNGEIVINEACKEDCTVIIDGDNSADSFGKENKSDNLTAPNISKTDEASIPTDLPDNSLIDKFLDVCEKSIKNSKYEYLKNTKFINLRKCYKKCSSLIGNSINFKKLVDENIERAQKTPAAAVISFNEIYQYVKELVDAESIEVSEENRRKLKRLERTIKLLVARIKVLENTEVDFNDEEDSTYLQLDRFTSRLNKLHGKYCKLLKKNPHSGRITYEKLDFVNSEYNEINRAISKQFKNNKKFPSYIEMEVFIKQVAEEHNLKLPEAKIKTESVRCFKKLGELLQNRRKKELYHAHYLYIRDSEDPAKNDTSLDSILKKNFSDGQVKIEKICEEYATKEELGEEEVVSEEESENSDTEDSESEDDD